MNIRSIRSKLNLLTELIHSIDKKIEIIIITETWLSPQEEEFFNIDDFNLVHVSKDRQGTYRGGGVCIYVRKKFRVINVDNFPLVNCDVIHLFLPCNNLNIVAIYRSHQSDEAIFFDQFDRMLHQLNKDSKTLIVGDFNLDVLQQSNNSDLYIEIIKQNLFCSQVRQITRFYSKDSIEGTCIDHVFTQGLNVKTEICNCDFSDHCYILIEISKVHTEGRKINILKPIM